MPRRSLPIKRKQLLDIRGARAAAIFADLEGLGVFDFFAVFLAVVFDQQVAVSICLGPVSAAPAFFHILEAGLFVIGRGNGSYSFFTTTDTAFVVLGTQLFHGADFLVHDIVDIDGDGGFEGVGFLETVARIEKERILCQVRSVGAEEGNRHHEGCVLNQHSDIAMVGMVS